MAYASFVIVLVILLIQAVFWAVLQSVSEGSRHGFLANLWHSFRTIGFGPGDGGADGDTGDGGGDGGGD